MSKKCPNCNEYIPDEASFCMNCFTKISPVISEKSNENNKNKKIFSSKIFLTILAILIISGCATFVLCNQIGSNNITPSSSTTLNNVTKNTSSTAEIISTTSNATTVATSSASTTNTTTTTSTVTTTTNPTTEKTTTKKETTQPSGTMKYSSYGNGVVITSYSGNESNIIIPDKIEGKTVNAVSENAFSNNKYIKSITFEEGSSPKTLNIKSNAFNNLSSLTTLNLPSQIEAESFTDCISKCSKLNSVNISTKFKNSDFYSSNGIVYSSDNALVLYPAGKTSSSYAIPYKVKTIKNNAFKGNPYLTKIKFSKRDKLDVNWSNLFSSKNIKNLEAIEVYAGTDADIIGIQYFDGEINYYD